jgi:hypothetical protein
MKVFLEDITLQHAIETCENILEAHQDGSVTVPRRALEILKDSTDISMEGVEPFLMFCGY